MNRPWRDVTLLAFLVLTSSTRADEAGAVTAMEKLGAKIMRDENRSGKPVLGVFLHDRELTETSLKQLVSFKELQWLFLNKVRINDTDLKEIAVLKNLETLHLVDMKVTDSGLKHLTHLQRLWWLYLINTNVTEAGVKQLQDALPKCRISITTGTRTVPPGTAKAVKSDYPDIQIVVFIHHPGIFDSEDNMAAKKRDEQVIFKALKDHDIGYEYEGGLGRRGYQLSLNARDLGCWKETVGELMKTQKLKYYRSWTLDKHGYGLAPVPAW